MTKKNTSTLLPITLAALVGVLLFSLGTQTHRDNPTSVTGVLSSSVDQSMGERPTKHSGTEKLHIPTAQGEQANALTDLPPTAALNTPLYGSWDGEASNQQGQLTYTLPIETPIGPRGIRPDLSLTYHGGQFLLTGLSVIGRCSAVESIDGFPGSVRHDENDAFCLDGQRLLKTDQSGHYSLEQHNFSQIVAVGGTASNPDHWELRLPTGEVASYGNTQDSRVLNLTDNYATEWRLSERRDAFDVAISYSYARTNQNTTHIDEIAYSVHKISFLHTELGLDTKKFRPRGGGNFTPNEVLSSIEMRTDGTLKRRLKLDYGESAGTALPQLKKVELCDGSDNCLPPTKFRYAENLPDEGVWRTERKVHEDNLFASYDMVDVTGDGYPEACHFIFAYTDDFTSPIEKRLKMRCANTVHDTGIDRDNRGLSPEATLQWVDLNDDGLTDYCFSVAAGTYCTLNQGGTFGQVAQWSTVTSVMLKGRDPKHVFGEEGEAGHTEPEVPGMQLRYLDINHDRRPDLCLLTTHQMQCTLQAAAGGFTGQIQQYPLDLKDVTRASFIDINADARPDICAATEDTGFACHLENGVGTQHSFGSRTLWSTDSYLTGQDDLPRESLSLVDYNTDGLIDACFYADDHLWCLMNNGSRFEPRQKITAVAASYDSGWGPDKKRAAASLKYVDLNTDGLLDICVYEGSFELNCGFGQTDGTVSRFTPYRVLSPFEGEIPTKDDHVIYTLFDLELYSSHHPREFEISADPVRFVDVDSDGMVDICYRGDDGLRCATSEGREPARHLVGVDSEFHSSDFSYSSPYNPEVYTHDHTKIEGLRARYPQGPLLQSITSNNPAGGKNTLRFHYSGSRVDPVRGHHSFAQVSRSHDTTKEKTSTNFHQLYPLHGKPKGSTRSIDSSLVSQQQTIYVEKRHFGHPAAFALLPQKTVSQNYDLDGTLLDTTTVDYSGYDNYGYAQQVEEKTTDELEAKQYRVSTTNRYRHDTQARWHLGMLEQTTVTHTSPTGTLTRETEQVFDPLTGVLTSVTLEPNDPKKRHTSYSDFDRFGNAETATQLGDAGATRTVITEFNKSNGLHPQTVTNALGHEATWQYDNFCAKPVLYIGPNGETKNWRYDGLCRETYQLHTDGTETVTNYAASDGIQRGVSQPETDKIKITVRATGTPETSTVTDAWGNTLRSVHTGFNGKFVRSEQVYNAQGLLQQSSQPYQVESYTEAGYGLSWTRYRYDALGRVERIDQPSDEGDRTTQYRYTGRTTISTDPMYRDRTVIVDVKSNPVTITEPDGSVLSHEYDSLGNLTASNRNGVETTRIEYDAFSQKWKVQDLAMGEWRYTYNRFGELRTQTDANGQVTTLDYDVLGRVETKDVNGELSQYTYDEANYGLGKLHTASNKHRTTSYGYDQRSRLETTQDVINGETFIRQNVFDEAGRLHRQVYPGDIEIQRNYNEYGYLDSLSMPEDQLETPDLAELNKTIEEYTSQVARLEKAANEAEALALSHQALLDAAVAEMDRAATLSDHYGNAVESNNAAIAEFKKRQDSYEQSATAFRKAVATLRKETSRENPIFTLIETRNDGYHRYRYKRCGTFIVWKANCDSWFRLLKNYFNPGEWPKTLDIAKLYLNQAVKYDGYAESMLTLQESNANLASIYSEKQKEYSQKRDEALAKARALESTMEERVEEADNRLAELTDTEGAIDTLADVRTSLLEALRNGATGTDGERIKSVPSDHIPFWAVTRMDPAGRIAGQVTGNGVLSSRTYSHHTGELKKIRTVRGNTLLSEHDYRYYANSSLESSTESVTQIDRRFDYDSLDQLVYYSERHGVVNSANADIDHRYDYDLMGNKLNNIAGDRFDVDPLTGRLSSLTRPDGSYEQYLYDDNGNTLSGNGRTVTWTAFNKPALIQAGTTASSGEASTGAASSVSEEYRPASDGVITVEAENATLAGGAGAAEWALMDDLDAAGGSAVHVDGYNNWSAVNGSTLSVPVTITQSGDYQIFFRAKNLTAGEKSFWLMIDDQPIGPSGGKIYFHNDQWHWWNSYGKSNVTLSEGQHTITLRTRTAGIALDKFIVMPKGQAVPAGLGSVDSKVSLSTSLASNTNANQAQGSGASLAFRYDADHNRSEKLLTRSDGSSEHTLYIGNGFEYVTDTHGGQVTRKSRIHLSVGGQQIGLYIKTKVNDGAPVDSMRYLHTDALGNVDLITDHNGYEVARQHYLPFGERRQQFSDRGKNDTHQGYRGFTGHEHLDDVGLIHMNARVQDPSTGRFLSPDSLVPDANRFLAHNRYAYVLNNPYKYTDPSGHVFDPVTFFIGLAISYAASQSSDPDVQLIGSIIGASLTGYTAAATGNPAWVVTAAAASTAAAGGNSQDIIFSAASAWVAFGVGHGGAGGGSYFKGSTATFFAHAGSQGLLSAVQHGKDAFAQGAISAAAGHAVPGGKLTVGGVVGRTSAAAILGGLTSAALGGDARQGARRAALVHLFNDEANIVDYIVDARSVDRIPIRPEHLEKMKKLHSLALESANEVDREIRKLKRGEISARKRGQLIHKRWQEKAKAVFGDQVFTEQPYYLTRPVSNQPLGSSRIDLGDGPAIFPYFVVELKTGKTHDIPVGQLRRFRVNIPPTVPIYVIDID